MRLRRAIGIGSVTVLLCLAQRSAVHAQAGAQPQPVGVHDGGTRQVLESIFVPPMDKAPFQLTLATEWTRPLGRDGSYTLANRRRIMRDSAGRIYQERWDAGTKGR